MKKITKKIQDAKLEDVLVIIQRIVGNGRKKQIVKDYPDGEKRTVTHFLRFYYREGNKLNWEYSIEIFPGTKDPTKNEIETDLLGLSVEGRQIRTAVLLDIKYSTIWQELVNYVLSEMPKYEYFPADLDAPRPIDPLLVQEAIDKFWIEQGVKITIGDYYAEQLETYKKLGMKVDIDAMRTVAKPAPTARQDAPTVDAGQPDNIIADNQGGTVTYKRNEQGQTIIKGGTVNDGYSFEVGNKGVALKPFDASHFPANMQPVDVVETKRKSPKGNSGAKTRKKKKSLVPNKIAYKRKWALLYEFYDKHCGLEKKNAMQFRVFCDGYDGYDMPKWIPQDNEVLQNIIDAGRAGEIPKHDSIK